MSKGFDEESKYLQSNYVQKISLAFAVIGVVMAVVVIGVTSATFTKIENQRVVVDSITAPYPSLGLPQFQDYSWADITTLSSGATVNFYSSGGALSKNWIDNWLAPEMMAAFNIKVVRRQVSATTQTVAIVQNEILAKTGMNNGSVDLIWINQQNFATLANANQLYGPFATKLPNAINYNFSDPAIAYDSGLPINGMEMPFNGAQIVFIYNPLHVKSTSSINTIQNIKNWIVDNPGKFTYAAAWLSNSLYDYTGSAFVRQVFYALAGPYTDFLKGGQIVNEALYEQRCTPVWQFLRGLEPFLYKNSTFSGNMQNYPSSQTMVDWLFGQGNVR